MAGGATRQPSAYRKPPGLLEPGQPRVPVSGVFAGYGPQQPDGRIWQEKVRDTGNEWADYTLGPSRDSIEGLLSFSDAADMQDAATNNQELSSALWQGRWGDAARAAPWAGLSSAMAVLPGSLGPLDNTVRRATDVAPSAPAMGHNGGPAMTPYDLPPGSDPRYLGAAPDRSDMTFLRYGPKKVSARMQRAETAMLDPQNPIRQQLMKDIEAGRNFKGADWYNTEELRDWFINELGPEQGHQEWSDFIKLMGSSSAGSNVLTNIKGASAVRRLQHLDPEVPGTGMRYNEFVKTREAIGDYGAVAKAREQLLGEKGYGHRYNKLHEMTSARQQRGEWDGAPEPGTPGAKGSWTDNPKPKGFYNSFTGNPNNIAADLHFTRYMGMASNHPDWLVNGAEGANEFRAKRLASNPDLAQFFRSKTLKGKGGKPDKVLPVFDANKAAKSGLFDMQQAADEPAVWTPMPNANEYGAMEKLMAQIGKDVGLTAPQVQAALWMGAAKRTGVHQDSLGTFMELVRRRADIRAKETGSTRSEVLRNFIRNKGLLAVPAAGAAIPGLLEAGQGEDSNRQKEY